MLRASSYSLDLVSRVSVCCLQGVAVCDTGDVLKIVPEMVPHGAEVS